jgi:hypothetical protein
MSLSKAVLLATFGGPEKTSNNPGCAGMYYAYSVLLFPFQLPD